MKNCPECGRSVTDDKECSCRVSEMRFDPIQEMLIIHEKLDKMGLELKVMQESIESLAKASLSHSEALLAMIKGVNILNSAVEALDKKNKLT